MQEGLPTKIIGISGGKGGVGKSTVAVNLAVALARRNQRVALLDADLGLANVDVMLGLKPRLTLDDVVRGEATIQEVLLTGPGGFKVVPAGSGAAQTHARSLVSLSAAQHAALVDSLKTLDDQFDIFLIDTAAGISDLVMHFLRAAREQLLVVCNEPTSITDAYALMKAARNEFGIHRFRVVANQVRDAADARRLYERLSAVTDRFLDIALLPCVAIAYDECVRKAVRKQKAVVDAYPSSAAARAFGMLADEVIGWPRLGGGDELQSLVERMLPPEPPAAGSDARASSGLVA